MPAFIDETGNRYGKLTVLHRHEKNCGTQINWLCSCECGKIRVVSGTNLRKGRVTSCGCDGRFKYSRRRPRGLNLFPGARFGHLTLLEETIVVKGSDNTWKCKCDCGGIIALRGRELLSGMAQTCGRCVPRLYKTEVYRRAAKLLIERLEPGVTNLDDRLHEVVSDVFSMYSKTVDSWFEENIDKPPGGA